MLALRRIKCPAWSWAQYGKLHHTQFTCTCGQPEKSDPLGYQTPESEERTEEIFHRISLNLAWETNLCMCAKSIQSGPSLCDPMDCSPAGSSVHGILQARLLEWVVMPSSRGSSWPRPLLKYLSALWLMTPFTSCISKLLLGYDV